MLEAPSAATAPRPGRLDVVVDLAATMAMYAAETLEQIDELRLAHLADAEAAGRHSPMW